MGAKDSWKLKNIRKSKAPLNKPSRRYATIETLFSLSCKIHLVGMIFKKLFQPIFLSFIAAEYVAKLRGQFIDRDLR